MTPDSSQPIDFYKEAKKIDDHIAKEGMLVDEVADWARSIAARVEESTIERCAKQHILRVYDPNHDLVKRIYAPTALEKGETK